MALRWRLALVVIAAAAVVGGILPHGTSAVVERTMTQMVQTAEAPLWEPVYCADAICGKGNATPSAPTPAVVLTAVLGGVVAVAATTASVRRRRAQRAALPVGARDRFDHPPQFC